MIRQIRGRERGMSFWPFVIAVVFLLVAVYGWYEATQTKAQDKAKIDTLTRELEEEKTKDKPRAARLADIHLGIGESYVDPSDPNLPYASSATIATQLAAAMDRIREKGAVEMDADKYAGGQGQVEKMGSNRIKVRYFPAGAENSMWTVARFTEELESAASKWSTDFKKVSEDAAAAKAATTAAATAHSAALAEKDRANNDLRTAAAAADAAAKAREAEQTASIDAQKKRADQLEGEVTAAKQEKELAVAKAATELNQTKAELQNAMRKDAPYVSEGMDGAVLNAGAGIVIIDIGKKHMLKPGTVFTVYGRRKGGALVPKGQIKINVSRTDTADAIILEESPSDPIVMGDAVASPLFSKDRQLHLVLLGEFKKMGRSQAESRLKQLGAAIDPMVSAATDYVVIGTPGPGGEALEDSDTYKRAKDYHVQFITEEQLASMTNY